MIEIISEIAQLFVSTDPNILISGVEAGTAMLLSAAVGAGSQVYAAEQKEDQMEKRRKQMEKQREMQKKQFERRQKRREKLLKAKQKRQRREQKEISDNTPSRAQRANQSGRGRQTLIDSVTDTGEGTTETLG